MNHTAYRISEEDYKHSYFQFDKHTRIHFDGRADCVAIGRTKDGRAKIEFSKGTYNYIIVEKIRLTWRELWQRLYQKLNYKVRILLKS